MGNARLEGKVALITGGASGIGEAAARLFAQEGARITIADMQDEQGCEVEKSLGANGLYVRTDVSKGADVEAAVKQTVAKFGRLDILFNNAGISIVGPFILDLPEETFDRILAINLKGVWLGMRYAIPEIIKAGGGAIVNTASIAGLTGYVGQSGYGSSKGGVIALTRHCAIEYASQGVRVNAICPGSIVTPMAFRNRPGQTEAQVRASNARMNPLQRTGDAIDVARTALFLASGESAHVTGQVIAVDGGTTVSGYGVGPAPERLSL